MEIALNGAPEVRGVLEASLPFLEKKTSNLLRFLILREPVGSKYNFLRDDLVECPDLIGQNIRRLKSATPIDANLTKWQTVINSRWVNKGDEFSKRAQQDPSRL